MVLTLQHLTGYSSDITRTLPWKYPETILTPFLDASIPIWLVVWTPLKNSSQLGWLFPMYGKIKNVPNHQPAMNHSAPAFYAPALPFRPQATSATALRVWRRRRRARPAAECSCRWRRRASPWRTAVAPNCSTPWCRPGVDHCKRPLGLWDWIGSQATWKWLIISI